MIGGLILLVRSVIGGGVFAWLRFSAANATFTANGTFTESNPTTNSVTQSGQDQISTYTQHGVFNGDLTGSYTLDGTFTLHPDNMATFSGTITCTCTVAGKSGTLTYPITVTSAAY